METRSTGNQHQEKRVSQVQVQKLWIAHDENKKQILHESQQT